MDIDYWYNFEKSGSVFDYLLFKNAPGEDAEGAAHGDDRDARIDYQGAECR